MQQNVSYGGDRLVREWLATARKIKNLTHQEVANRVGIKRQYYGMIESGERTPSVNIAKS